MLYSPEQYSPSSISHSASLYLTENNSQWKEETKYFDFQEFPILSFSTNFSFDALWNEISQQVNEFIYSTILLKETIKLLDPNGQPIPSVVFSVKLILNPIVDMTSSSFSVSNKMTFRLTLQMEGQGEEEDDNESKGASESEDDEDEGSGLKVIEFDLKAPAFCSNDSDFPVDLSSPFVSQKLQNLNYFQVLSKISFFYSVKLFGRLN